nr:aspartyl protease family protein [Bacteroidota bacterium]
MRNILILILVCSLLFINNILKSQESEQIALPDGAIPIVARGHMYIQGSADNVAMNFVFDTGASGLYYDTTFYSCNNFEYENLANAKLPGAGSTPQDVIVILDTVEFSFGEQLYQTTRVPVLKLKSILGDFSDGIIGLYKNRLPEKHGL